MDKETLQKIKDKKNRAIFTIVRNEDKFLPIWLKYYEKYFNKRDMYILDHQSTDGSTDFLRNKGYNPIVIENDTVLDHKWINTKVKWFQQILLSQYDNVVFTEVDELIYHKDGLDNYIKNFKKAHICCKGYNIINIPEEEKEIDWNKPLLKQRKYMYAFHLQDKPLLSKLPTDWCYGFHNCPNTNEIDDDLMLIHLHQLDYKYAQERNKKYHNQKINMEENKKGFGTHKFLTGKAFDDLYFKYNQNMFEIPEDIKEMI